MYELSLTEDEVYLIICALRAVSPTGGGSDTFHLAGKISQQTHVEEDAETVGSMQMTARDEINEFLIEN